MPRPSRSATNGNGERKATTGGGDPIDRRRRFARPRPNVRA